MASMRPRTRKDGSTFWEVLFRHDGRQRSLSFETADHAGKFKELVGLVGAGKALAAYDLAPAPRAANGSSVTVAEWVEHHIEHLIGCERKTIDEYRRFLKRDIAPGLGPIPLMSLTGEHLARWVQELKAKGNSGKTIRNKHGFVSSALNAAVKSGHIAVNPAVGQRLPRTERKEMVFLSKEEYHLLHGCFSDHYKPFVEFLAATGARFSEATALQPKDIDREGATVRISRAWKRIPGEGYELGPPKTKRSIRTIGVPRSVFDALDLSHEWLFVNTAGNPVRIYGWRENVWYPALVKAEEKGLAKRPRVHDLRHTCASWMIHAGVPLPVIQQHLGHESIETTVAVYGHLDRRSMQAAADAIGRALGG
jgi:integrase